MGKEKQYLLGRGWNVTCHSLAVTYLSMTSRHTWWKREDSAVLTAERSDNSASNPVGIKVKNTSEVMLIPVFLSTTWWKWSSAFRHLHPKIHSPDWWAFCIIPEWWSSEQLKTSKLRDIWETVMGKKSLRSCGDWTECDILCGTLEWEWDWEKQESLNESYAVANNYVFVLIH